MTSTCPETDSLARKLLNECRIAGYHEAAVYPGAQELTRLIRIPGIVADGAERLTAFVEGPLVAIGFAVDFHSHSTYFGGDKAKGAMIYGQFPDRRSLPAIGQTPDRRRQV